MDQGAGDPMASRRGNDVDAAKPRRKLRMRLHVMFDDRGGADRVFGFIHRDDGNRNPGGVHACPNMVEPTVDRPASIEMSPFVELPLRDDWRPSWMLRERADLHVRRARPADTIYLDLRYLISPVCISGSSLPRSRDVL